MPLKKKSPKRKKKLRVEKPGAWVERLYYQKPDFARLYKERERLLNESKSTS